MDLKGIRINKDILNELERSARKMNEPARRTLTEMFKVLGYKEDIELAKRVVKEWLRSVDIPDYGSPEVARTLFIVLVDEP